jgi:hypothetical protein
MALSSSVKLSKEIHSGILTLQTNWKASTASSVIAELLRL